MTSRSPENAAVNRKRKAHRKSRGGCRNCKLRRVKCDEAKIRCQNCVSYGVACNYDLSVGDLQIPNAREITQEQFSVVLPDRITSPSFQIPNNSDIPSFQMDTSMMERLYRFESRTVLTVGTGEASLLYRNEIPKLAFSHPYLMHIIQTLTAIHDRYLSDTPERQSYAEVHHWSLAANYFNRKLSTPLQDSDYDALWGTAALLGVTAFSSNAQSTPEESWPFKEGSMNEWLPLCEGKRTIFRIANPLVRDNSVFTKLVHTDENKVPFFAKIECNMEDVPAAWVELFELRDEKTRERSPYYSAVLLLGRLMKIECTQSEMPIFFSFISRIESDFRTLLELKDPRALLVMAIWYSKLLHAQWWIDKRATLECKSIMIYLEKYHGDNKAIMEELDYPRRRCES